MRVVRESTGSVPVHGVLGGRSRPVLRRARRPLRDWTLLVPFGRVAMRLRNPFVRKPKEFPSHLWTQCPNCGEMLFNKQLARNQSVCTNCGHHFKLSAKERLELLADARSFTETDADMVSSDPLGFVDSKTYPDRIAAAQAKPGP